MSQHLDVLNDLGKQFEGLATNSQIARHRSWRNLSRRAVMSVVVVVLGASATAAALTLTSGSSQPVRLYGLRLCPSAYPVEADPSARIAYPSAYPGNEIHLASRRVDCFPTLGAALDDGYTRAATPAGYNQLGSLYIEAAPSSVRDICRTAARRLHVTVYCPTKLPVPWLSPAINYNCPTVACSAPVLSLSGSFDAPDTYVGSSAGTGDVTIWQAAKSAQRLYPYLVGCLGDDRPRMVGQTTFRGRPATWYACSIFGHGISSMLEWERGKESYGVTANGPPTMRKRLAAYIARHLVAYRPAESDQA